MSEQEKQEGQKTVVSFVSGLLVGGLLVWAFSGSPREDAPVDGVNEDGEEVVAGEEIELTGNGDETDEATETPATPSTPEMVVGDGSLTVDDQAAGSSVSLTTATFPTEEGWVAVRIYNDGQMGSILGAARYSKVQGLVPTTVQLLAPTVAGREYAVVFFSEDGNREFNLDGDAQLETGMTTFTAE